MVFAQSGPELWAQIHTALGLQASSRDNRAIAEETACSLVLA